MLLQQGGLGGPYASIDTATLVATALNGTTPLGVGSGVPANAQGSQVFTADLVTTLDGAHLWNQYEGTDGNQHYWNAGPAASAEYDQVGGFLWLTTGVGSAGQVVQGATELMTLSPAGALNLLYGTLSVARDPATAFEVATLNYVSNNTVQTFNQRQGQVTLNAADVYSALKLCDPLATQPWVNQAISNSIQNLLYTCPFVNTWNGRQGQVYLMLSDITCVFYQSGQQPISPTPAFNSYDDSIATTRWVTEHPAATTSATPPQNPQSGTLWWDSNDGNLYVYYQDPTSTQWVSAMAAGDSGLSEADADARYLMQTGGQLSGPLTSSVTNAATTTVQAPLTSSWTLSGVQTSGNPFGWTFDVSDNLDARPLGALTTYYVLDVLGGSAGGGRSSFYSQLALTAPTLDAQAGPHGLFYNALASQVSANSNQGGTATTGSANLVGYTCEAYLTSGATFINILEAVEVGVGVLPGASAYFVSGIKVSPQLNGIAPITCFNAFAIGGALAGTEGFHIGLCFCSAESGAGNFGIAPTGTLIGTNIGGTVAHGIDLSAITCTTDQFRGAGITINPIGNIAVGTGQITTAELTLNSADVGNNAGPIIFFQWGGVTRGGLSGYSGYFGGAYDSRVALCGVDGLVLSVANQTNTVTVDAGGYLNAATGVRVGTATGPSWTSGSGAPTGTAPPGSLYSNTAGTTGTHLYVSAGGGTWNPVTGV